MEEGEERKGMMGVAGPGTTDVTPSGREMGMAEAGARSDTRACDSSCRVTVGFRRTRPRLFTLCMMQPCKLARACCDVAAATAGGALLEWYSAEEGLYALPRTANQTRRQPSRNSKRLHKYIKRTKRGRVQRHIATQALNPCHLDDRRAEPL